MYKQRDSQRNQRGTADEGRTMKRQPVGATAKGAHRRGRVLLKAETLIGTVLGTCTLQKIIGQGGMGAVFLAQQSRPRRQVAVKVFLPMATLTPSQMAAFLERFRRETDAAASLEHPNILPVHEYGEQDGIAYLVMPYISGGTLRDEMEIEGPLPLLTIASYLDQLAAALDCAHGRGVVHRDIKPANILMTSEKRLLLTDFGLVKIVGGGQIPQTRLTGDGVPVGTPDYMSPEQVIGNPVDGRADLYALGVILYQMVTGMTPFQGETPMQIAAQHLQSPPPSPHLWRSDLPMGAEQVMLRALAKRPEDRYGSGQELTGAFRTALATSERPFGLGNQGQSITPVASSTSGRLFTPRSLFDPTWKTGMLPAVGNDHVLGQPTGTPGIFPTASIPAATGTFPAAPQGGAGGMGLLSRTGKFPQVNGATNHLPSVMANNTQGPRGAMPPATGVQPAVFPPTFGQNPSPTAPLPTPISVTNKLPTSTLSTGMGAQAMTFPTIPTTQMSPVLNTTGALMVPTQDGGTMKLTGPVKVIQVPIAGQPGHYVTGLLPVAPAPVQPETSSPAKKAAKKRFTLFAITFALLLILLASGGAFWFFSTHPHSGQTSLSGTSGLPQVASTPNPKATAAALATATVTANILLSDPLDQNYHGFPTTPANIYVFKGGAYHITARGTRGSVAMLPEKPFTSPLVYTLTMDEISGDDASPVNSFGMVMGFSQQTKNGKMITTFYSLEVVNTKGGEYQFWKYDDTNASATSSPWVQELWHQAFGAEFHEGQGPANTNTFRISFNAGKFVFSVNGHVVKLFQDNSYPSGMVGMLVNLDGTEVAFSHMLITGN